jgi:hypothetical protein
MDPRTRLVCFLLLPVGLALIPSLGVTDPERPATCLSELHGRIGLGSKVAVADTAGRTLQGTLERLDPGNSLLTLRTFDPSTSRFSDLDIPASAIRSISYHTDRRSLRGPVLLGAALGTVGLLIAASIQGTSDNTGDKTRTQSLIVFPTLSATTGFLMGMALSPKRVEEGTVECPGSRLGD